MVSRESAPACNYQLSIMAWWRNEGKSKLFWKLAVLPSFRVWVYYLLELFWQFVMKFKWFYLDRCLLSCISPMNKRVIQRSSSPHIFGGWLWPAGIFPLLSLPSHFPFHTVEASQPKLENNMQLKGENKLQILCDHESLFFINYCLLVSLFACWLLLQLLLCMVPYT